ncbi:hypothetical protein CASFOL_009219 [Castilleja foliolosa]|uniref:Uncharacterized protein n=1 Tax=Castilleja foliolosa TaxID=1961234 RepID=A0ABD3E0M7_9LAMI
MDSDWAGRVAILAVIKNGQFQSATARLRLIFCCNCRAPTSDYQMGKIGPGFGVGALEDLDA